MKNFKNKEAEGIGREAIRRNQAGEKDATGEKKAAAAHAEDIEINDTDANAPEVDQRVHRASRIIYIKHPKIKKQIQEPLIELY